MLKPGLKVRRIDLDQQIALADELVVIDQHLGRLPADARGDADNVAGDEGVVGLLKLSGVQPPEKTADDGANQDDAENYHGDRPLVERRLLRGVVFFLFAFVGLLHTGFICFVNLRWRRFLASGESIGAAEGFGHRGR